MDREKVIKGLECCSNSQKNRCEANSCPYWVSECCCIDDMLNDALALLKKREAVEPILIRKGRNKNYNDYVCPHCDNEVVYEQNYCSECGVRFLWEGR